MSAESLEVFGECRQHAEPVLPVVDLQALERGETVVRLDDFFCDLARVSGHRRCADAFLRQPSAADARRRTCCAGCGRGCSCDHLLGDVTVGLQCFAMHFVEGWNVVVPLQQRCRWSGQLDRPRVQPPHRIDHRMVVGIEDVLLKLGVAGDVDLCDALVGDAVQVIKRIEAVIARGDVDVVDVEQNSAVGALPRPR